MSRKILMARTLFAGIALLFATACDYTVTVEISYPGDWTGEIQVFTFCDPDANGRVKPVSTGYPVSGKGTRPFEYGDSPCEVSASITRIGQCLGPVNIEICRTGTSDCTKTSVPCGTEPAKASRKA